MNTKSTNSRSDDQNLDLQISIGKDTSMGDCPSISMDPEVERQIEKYANTDTSRELAGVLLGELTGDSAKPEVRILAAIEAKYTEAVHTSVKFTHATWDYINKVKDEQYPHLRIVGWFHTHPGFGIFLSRWDMFIQENFFNLPWQIAYVVDPVGGTRGFFRWENGKVRPVEKPAGEPLPPLVVEEPQHIPAPARRPSRLPAIAAGIAIVGLTAAVVYLAFFRPPQVRIVEKVVVKRVEVPVPEESRYEQPAGTKQVMWEPYVVQRGDCLWRIAEARYGSGRYMYAISQLNRMDKNSKLYAGTVIDLPCKELADKLCHVRRMRK